MEKIEAEIEKIEKEIRETPYHKGTEHHIGRLKAKLSKLRNKLFEGYGKKGKRLGYAIKKQGDATVILIGPPSCGKSTLINKLTNAKSKIAPYAFTTINVIPGMMEYNHAKIQILDVPGLIEGAEEGKGRGLEVLSVARGCDLIVVMSDVFRPDAINKIKEILHKNYIRINIVRPNITFVKKASGGIILRTNIKQDFSKETLKQITSELGIKNAEIIINQKITIDDLIDALSANRIYLPAIFVLNKADLLSNQNKKLKLSIQEDEEILLISAEKEIGLEKLKQKIWQKLGLITIFLLPKGEKSQERFPIVISKGSTLYDCALKIGESFARKVNYAKIWGGGAKFPGQKVPLTYKVQEAMEVYFL